MGGNRACRPGARLDGCAGRRGKDVIHHVAGVAHARRLEAQDLGLLIGGGAMFDAMGNGDAFAGGKLHDAIAEFDPEAAPPDQEEFVFPLVDMPG